MSGGRILVGADAKARRVPRLEPARAYRVLFVLGILLLVAGLVDIALALYPIQLGTPEWRFVTGVTLITGWPILLLGSAFVIMAGIALEHPPRLLFGAAVGGVLSAALVLLLLAVIAGREAALASADLARRPVLGKSILRSGLTGVIYVIAQSLLAWTGFSVWRSLATNVEEPQHSRPE